MTSKKKHFSKIKDEDKIEILNEVGQKNHSVQVWEESENDFTELTGKSFEKENLILILFGQNDCKKYLEKSVLIKFSCFGMDYFSTGILKPLEGKEFYYTKFSDEVFKFDKRKDIRLPLEYAEKIVFQISPSKKEYHFTCIDVSASGAGLVMDSDHANTFSKGKKITNGVLELNSLSFTIPQANVRHIRDYDKEGVRKVVGILFVNLPYPIKNALTVEINKNIFKFLSSENQKEKD